MGAKRLGEIMHGGKRAGAGRKPSSIDLGELEKLCSLQCTDEDVAGVFGVKGRTIERRRQREPAFAAAMGRGRAKGRVSMRRGLHVQALKGNTAALIFLAKNVLDYRDARNAGAIPINNGPDLTKDNGWSGDAADLMALYRELTMKEK